MASLSGRNAMGLIVSYLLIMFIFVIPKMSPASAQSNNFGGTVFRSNPEVVTTIGSWDPAFTTIQIARNGRDALLVEVFSNRVETTHIREVDGLQIRVNDWNGDGIPEERLSVQKGKIVRLEAFMCGRFWDATVVSNNWTIDGRLLVRDSEKQWYLSTNNIPLAVETNTTSMNSIRQTPEYLELLRADVWIAGARYGFSGESKNKSSMALRRFVKDPKAKEIFLEILDRAMPAGQLYALCGLYRVDQNIFWKKVRPFLKTTNSVIGIHADIEIEERVCDVVFAPCDRCKKSPEEITNNPKLLFECLSMHKRENDDFLILDIVGGGYPGKLIDGW